MVYIIDYEIFGVYEKNTPWVSLRADVESIPSIGKVFEGGLLRLGEKKNV